MRKYGYRKDKYDGRDLLAAVGDVPLPSRVDLRETQLLPPIEDQGNLGSCVAHAATAAIEYLERRSATADVERSRLFVYYGAREIEGTIKEDAGCQIRDAFKVLNKLGAPDEALWPYNPRKFRTKPTKVAYANAALSRLFKYQRVKVNTLAIKQTLAQSLPVVIGVDLYASFESDAVAASGEVPLPTHAEETIGGHAMLAVGFDDAQQAFLVRNSWGKTWGQQGYCWMPYAYVGNAKLGGDYWVAMEY